MQRIDGEIYVKRKEFYKSYVFSERILNVVLYYLLFTRIIADEWNNSSDVSSIQPSYSTYFIFMLLL